MSGDDIQHQHLVIRFLHNTFVFDINMFLYPSTTTAYRRGISDTSLITGLLRWQKKLHPCSFCIEPYIIAFLLTTHCC
ncbi:hypothetical protein AM349_08275 [Citrobacter freundii]|uniref:Uncharacterized protein n=1 Tax=Citrobacter freundii TaxID=546 RepID=A0A7G2IJI1_CITFR|nr:hypothetical protein AM349_08275 [Citrobacter freundii]AUU26758.1 hypothetical protein MC62_012570 [Citrobacter freundii]AYL42936.1 hypothetical protein CUC45_11930 [Citrobacter freundii]CDL37120.1 hypothetical protein [Citrobacter freundii]HAU5690968.1 hypothetical protein [Citrobacter freundii]